jgi:hypothetical protein
LSAKAAFTPEDAVLKKEAEEFSYENADDESKLPETASRIQVQPEEDV